MSGLREGEAKTNKGDDDPRDPLTAFILRMIRRKKNEPSDEEEKMNHF